MRLDLGLASSLLLVTAGCTTGAAPIGQASEAIINGQVETGRPYVSWLQTPTGPDMAAMCTASLIGTRTMLTAAHCIENATGDSVVRFPDINLNIGVTSRTIHDGWTDAGGPTQASVGMDVAVLGLAQDVPGVEPVRIASTAPWAGETVHLVGFGITSNDGTDFGVLHGGDNQIDSVGDYYYDITDTDATHALTEHGDSGGPDLVVVDGTTYIVGTHSISTGQQSSLLGLLDESSCSSTRTDTQADFITAQAAGNLYQGDGHYEKDPPVSSVVFPSQITADQAFTVHVLASDDIRVVFTQLQVDDMTMLSMPSDDPSVDYTQVLTLSAGAHRIAVGAIDGANHTVAAAYNLVVSADASTPTPTPTPTPATSGDMPDPGTAGTPAMPATPDPMMANPTATPAKGCSYGGSGHDASATPLLALALIALALYQRRRTPRSSF